MNQLVSLLKADISKLCRSAEDNVIIRVFENSSSVFFTLEEFFNQYNPEEIGKGQCNLIFKIDCEGKTITTFQLKDMYNCCGIIVASDLFISQGLRRKGLGTLITKFMMEFSKYYGYGVIQASDITKNDPQRKIFEKLNWIPCLSFDNPKTKNNLTIWLHKF